MNQFLEWVSRLFGSWKFWVVVPPWDIGIRIRLGRNATALKPGPHWRIPFLDDVTLVNTRLRVTTTPPVTIGSEREGHSRVLTAAIGFSVTNPLEAMLRYEMPGAAVQSYATAEMVTATSCDRVRDALKEVFEPHGVLIEFVRFIESVEVQTFKILQGQTHGIYSDGGGIPASAGHLARY